MPDGLAGYWSSRWMFERGLALMYLVAFLCAANQFVPLLGERGLLPVPHFVRAVPFRVSPSLFYLSHTDTTFRVAAWIGVALSCVAVVGLLQQSAAASAAMWTAMWVLYLSFVNVGQVFYGFGWESLLLETGFLAIFLGASTTAPSAIVIWLLRWVLFRDMFGAGLIKRLLFFAYGLASYVIFLATFLYAIAFVGGIAVPARLDGPLQTSLPAALAIDCALLTVFAVQHSVMARRWFKERWTQIVPWTIERSTFVLCASLALLLLFWQWRPLGIEIWSIENAAARAVLWTLFAAGWATVLIVTFLINHFDLFGLRQVWLPLIGRPYTRVSFRTPLPYRFVRHPLYFGFLLAFWMTPTMTLAHLVFAIATTAYIVLAIQFEERDLVHEHGAAYEEYRRNVPMLLPHGRPLQTTGARDVLAPAATPQTR